MCSQSSPLSGGTLSLQKVIVRQEGLASQRASLLRSAGSAAGQTRQGQRVGAAGKPRQQSEEHLEAGPDRSGAVRQPLPRGLPACAR